MQQHNNEKIAIITTNRRNLIRSLMTSLVDEGQSAVPESINDFFDLFEAIENGLQKV